MPIEAIASTNSTATGMSVSWSGVCRSLHGSVTTGPNGITENATNAGTVAITGARMKTTLSAAVGMMSSFSASFTPSARLCSRPNGPFTFGPMRCCIRATTRRSNQMLNSVSSTRITKISSALIRTSHHGSWPKAPRPLAPALGRADRGPSLVGSLQAYAGPGRGQVGEDTVAGGVRGHPDHVVGEVVGHLDRAA